AATAVAAAAGRPPLLSRRSGPADQLGDDVNVRVVDRRVDVGRDEVPRQARGPRLCRVAHDDALDLHRPARSRRDSLALVEEQLYYPAADRPAAQQRDIQNVAHVRDIATRAVSGEWAGVIGYRNVCSFTDGGTQKSIAK